MSSLLDRQPYDTKICQIQSLPQKVCIIIINIDNAGVLHLYSAFKFTK